MRDLENLQMTDEGHGYGSTKLQNLLLMGRSHSVAAMG